eukprot:7886866-Pyramimonas_sp.AAC.1
MPPRAARAAEASQRMPDEIAARTDPPDDSLCRRCVERDDWKRSLTPQCHGCAACKDVFDKGAWGAAIMRHHLGRRELCTCTDPDNAHP